MSAFLIFHSAVKDPEKFQAYAQAVPATLKSFGGTLMAKGKSARVLSGKHDHSTVGILKFPDLSSAHGWYESEAYQALIPNRNEAADMTVISYEEPARESGTYERPKPCKKDPIARHLSQARRTSVAGSAHGPKTTRATSRK